LLLIINDNEREVIGGVAEELPEHLRIKILKKMISKSMDKRSSPSDEVDIEKIVWDKLVDDKARELMGKARSLYPDKYMFVLRVFYELIRNNSVKEFDGYTTLVLLHRLGVPVKPDMRIKFIKDGREVDMREYLD